MLLKERFGLAFIVVLYALCKSIGTRLMKRPQCSILQALNTEGEVTVTGSHDVEKNISDILKAIDSLISLNGIYVSAIRLQLDTLLRIWEGRYYLDSMR
jgi:hypothetical protein